MRKAKSLISDIFIYGIGNFLNKLILLILVPLYTKEFTAEQFATVDLLSNLIELLFPIVTLSISDAVFRFVIDESKNRKIIFLHGFYILIAGNIICGLSFSLVNIMHSIHYSLILQLVFLSYSLKSFIAQYSRGIGKSRVFALSGIINAITLLILNFIFISFLGIKIKGYFYSQILANFFSVFYLSFHIDLKENLKLIVPKKFLITKMLKFSIPLIPNSFSWWFVNIFSRYIILLYHGPYFAGLFAAASRLAGIINLISLIFQQAWQYSSANEFNSKDRDLFYRWVFSNYSILVLFIGSLVIGLSPIISNIFLSGDFKHAYIFIPFLFYSAIIGSFCYFYGTIYMASKSTQINMNSTLLGALINIILTILFTKYNYFYAVLSILISNIIILSIRMKFLTIKILTNHKIWYLSLIILFIETIILTIDKLNYIFWTILFALLIILLNIKRIILNITIYKNFK